MLLFYTGTQTDTTTLGQSGAGTKSNEGVIHILQTSKFTDIPTTHISGMEGSHLREIQLA